MLRDLRASALVFFSSVFLCLVILVPPQATEYLRFVVTGDMSTPAKAFVLIWPTVLAAAAFALSLIAVVPPGERPRSGAAVLAFVATLLPFTGLAGGLYMAKAWSWPGWPEQNTLGIAVLGTALLCSALASAGTMLFLDGHDSNWRARLLRICLGSVAAVVIGVSLAVPFLAQDRVVAFSQLLSPLGIVAIFSAVACILFTLFSTLSLRVRVWSALSLLIWLLVLSVTGWNDNHHVRTIGSHTKQVEVAGNLREWLSTRPDKGWYGEDPYPVFLVAAQGGGSYAAYQAAAVLTELDARWPQFSHHVFAISSVSGGSLGSVLYTTLKSLSASRDQFCPADIGMSLRGAAELYLDYDFLSPLLLLGLFPDLVQNVLPWPVPQYDRALGLEYAFEEAWTRLAGHCGWSNEPNAFSTAFDTLRWDSAYKIPRPALFLNVTQEGTGKPLTVSTAELPHHFGDRLVTSVWNAGLEQDLRVSTAVGLSARFPFVTPSGWFMATNAEYLGLTTEAPLRLNDGGYYDNSGTDVLLNVAMSLKSMAANESAKISVYVIVIGDASFTIAKYNDAWNSLRTASDSRIPPDVHATLSKILDHPRIAPVASNAIFDALYIPELRTLFGSREFRSKESVKRLLRTNNLDLMAAHLSSQSFTLFREESFNGTSFLFPLNDTTPDMPVSWLISRPTRSRVALRTGGSDCEVKGPVPQIRWKVGAELLKSFMEDHGEGVIGALDNWTANCSMEALLELKRETPEGGNTGVSP